MSLFKSIKKSTANLIPSPITIDLEKGGTRSVEQVAPIQIVSMSRAHLDGSRK